MPLVRTAYTPFTAFDSQPAETTGEYTFPNGEVVAVIVHVLNNGGAENPAALISIANSGADLGWTKRVAADCGSSFDYNVAEIIFTAVGDGNPHTITISKTGANGIVWHIAPYSWSGHNVASPFGAKLQLTSTVSDGAWNPTLDAAPAADSEVIGAIGGPVNSGAPTIDVGSGCTELFDYNQVDFSVTQAQVRTGSTSTTFPWADVIVGGGGYYHNPAGVALEIKAAAASGQIAGTASITFTPAGTAQRLRNAAATTSLAFGNSSRLTGKANALAAALLTFASVASQSAYANRSGSATLTFSQQGSLSGFADSIGASTMSFSLQGYLRAYANSRAAATLEFSQAGTLVSIFVTDVDSDESITSIQTGATFAGADLGANPAARTVTIEQGAVSVTQSQVSGDATSGVFDVTFDPGGSPSLAHLKYGAATFRVTVGAGSATRAITITVPAGRSYVDLSTPDTEASNRITAVADLAAGDQLEVSNVQGIGSPTPTIADVTVNADATFDCAASVTSFDVRAWSVSDSIWGTVGTQNLDVGQIIGDSTLSFTNSARLVGGGNLISTTTLTFSASGVAAKYGNIRSDASLSFSVAASAKAYVYASAVSSISFNVAATSGGQTNILGDTTITFVGAATAKAFGNMGGGAAFTIDGTPRISAYASNVGAAQISFSPSASVKGYAVAIGQGTITFSSVATSGNQANISGAATFTLSAAAEIDAVGNGAAIGSLEFGSSAMLRAYAGASAISSITFSTVAAAKAYAYLSGGGSIVFVGDAASNQQRNIVGTTSMALSAAGTAALIANARSSISMTFSVPDASIRAYSNLYSQGDMSFDGDGTLSSVANIYGQSSLVFSTSARVAAAFISGANIFSVSLQQTEFSIPSTFK